MAWAKFPSRWVREGQLAQLRWSQLRGNGTAALLLLMAIAIGINRKPMKKWVELEEDDKSPEPVETAPLTYEFLQDTTGISKGKVADGLRLLRELRVIEATRRGRNVIYALPQTLVKGDWCMLPQSHLYKLRVLQAFRGFRLRDRWEFNCLKLYLVLLTFRPSYRSTTWVNYTTIVLYTGMRREEVHQAASHLLNFDLIRIERENTEDAVALTSNAYRIRGFDHYPQTTAANFA